MKTRISIIAALLAGVVPAVAQETYENANIATEDLNGTARYVGMGGALDALGADISTIGTNPAGIGLFRRSSVSTSFGFVSQEGATEFANGNKTNMSFDQIGLVWSTRLGRSSFVNFAFNYHKSRNFDYILNAAGDLGGDKSQNQASYNKGAQADYEGWDIFNDNAFSQLDELYYGAVLGYVSAVNPDVNDYYCYPSTGYDMGRVNTGYIGEYDFNISGNVNDRVYLGLTIGVHDVHYKGYSLYNETLADNMDGLGRVQVEDSRAITGTGYDMKAGVIFRPMAESPFRIGLSIATPTFYDLTTSNYTALYVDGNGADGRTRGSLASSDITNSYDFKLYTPWKFGLSLGHTIGNYLALGASYEYADYGSVDNRVNNGNDWDWDESDADMPMNRHTEQTQKGVSTLKVGGEFKADANLAVRLGFNYVSPMYNKNGMKDGMLDSYGISYQSATDYTNWKDTYRVTAGLGYRWDKFSLDVAYQYSQTNGDFRPFSDVVDAGNMPASVEVSNKRHQMICTLGYTF